MDTKALRQKILDLAIHGKLVPQDPNDEPASVLLERIRAEKERLIKEGKIKKGKKSAKTSDKPHYPYELPKGWEWCKLKDIAYVGTGATPLTACKYYYENGNIAWINSSSTKVPFIVKASNFITRKAIEETNCLIYPKGTLVIAMYGEGKTRGQISELLIDAATNQACAAVRPYSEATKEYLKLFFKGNYLHIRAMAEGGNQPNLSVGKIQNYEIPLPPLNEQKRILDKAKKMLLQIDNVEIEKRGCQKDIKQAKSKILDLAIHGKLVPQDPNDEPAIELLKRINPKAEIISDNGHYQKLPSGWCMTNIESLFEAVSAKRVLKSEWKNKGIPFYRAREIVQLSKEGIADKNLFVSEEHYSELKEKYGVPNCDDIMISAVGSIGYTYIVKKGDVFYYKDASVLCLKNTNHWNPTFFKIWLASPFLQEQMYKNSKGTTVNTITLEKLKGYVIPFPPITEQHRIVSKIEGLFSLLDNIASSL